MSEYKKPMTNAQEEEEVDGNEMVDQQNAETQQIIETGAVTPTKGKYVIHCLTIVGQVEGHYILPPQNKTTKYEHVIPQLVAIQENPEIEGLIIILNTVGGDVEAGLAIAELVSGMQKPTVSLVLGGGHSIGVPLAVSAKKSFIVPSATMTIHPVRMNGVVLGVPQTLSYFDKMQERIVRFVEENSNISSKQFRHLMMNTGELVMDVGTVLDGQQAVERGLIDHLGGLNDAIECLYDLIEQDKAERQRQQEQEEEMRPKTKRRSQQSPKSQANKVRPRQRATDREYRVRHGYVASQEMPQAYSSVQKNLTDSDTLNQLIPAHNISQLIDQMQNRRQHSVQNSAHTLYKSRHKRRPQDLSHKPAAYNGGGEHCNVNPFGHPAPHAD